MNEKITSSAKFSADLHILRYPCTNNIASLKLEVVFKSIRIRDFFSFLGSFVVTLHENGSDPRVECCYAHHYTSEWWASSVRSCQLDKWTALQYLLKRGRLHIPIPALFSQAKAKLGYFGACSLEWSLERAGANKFLHPIFFS